MKRNKLFIVLILMVFATMLLAQKTTDPIDKRWKTVEDLAEKQLPESALKEVEAILTQARKEKNSVEVIKAMVYEMRFTLEKNPDEAPALIRDFEAFTDKSTDPAERALLHSMTAELYAQFYQRDSYTINRRTEVTGFVPEDTKEWTKNIYFDKISKHLEASMENPTVLQHTDALKFAALLEKGDDSRTLQPTLFDFLGYRKIDILQQITQATTVKNPLKQVELFEDIPQLIKLKQDTAFKNSIENPILETYQQLLAYRLSEKSVLALLYADLHYLRYLKQHTGLVKGDSLYLSALNRLKKQYFDNEAVIEVYGEIANYYMEQANLSAGKSYKKTAYDICAEGLKRFPGYNRIEMLENMQHTIIQKDVNISNKQVEKPATNLEIQINSANIASLKLSVYRVTASAEDYYSYRQNNQNNKELYPNRALIETRNIVLKPDSNFWTVRTIIDIKTGDYGIYEYTLEDADPENNMEKVIGNYTVSDLAFIIRTNKPDLVDFYVLDRNTGKPQPEVNVSICNNKWRSGVGSEIEKTTQCKTDKAGLGEFPIIPNNFNYVLFFEKGNDRYFSSNSYSNYYSQNAPEDAKARLNLFTDRSLYRPGQTVYFKGIAYYSNKTKQQTITGGDYEVTLVDANGQKVSSKKFKTNEYGSFAGEFVLPEGGLNGSFQLKSGKFSQFIWVEEYKRPTFEVKIDKPKTEVSFGEKVTLTGNVRAYAGNFLGDTKIKYRVVRRTHRFCWWFSEPDTEIKNGTTASKGDGTFEVSFIPEKTRNEEMPLRGQFYTYTVYAEVTDPKGETQQGEQSLSVGDKSLFILADVAPKADKKQAFNVDVRTETLNGEKVNATVRYTLYRIRETDKYAEDIDEDIADDIVSVSELETAEKVMNGTFDTRSKILNLDVTGLDPGRYKIQFSTLDARGREVTIEKIVVIYDVNDKRPPVKSYMWFVAPKTECEPGGKVQIHFGTSTGNSSVLYEVMQGNTVLESRWVPFTNEIKTFDILFKESYGPGITVMFTFMKEEHLFTKSIQLTRKKTEKKLTPALSVFRNKLQPGEKAEWTLTVPESAGSKKPSELLATMYDASLDALRLHSWYFNPAYQETFQNSPEWTEDAIKRGSDNSSFRLPDKTIQDFRLNQLNWYGLNISNRVTFMIRGRVSGISVADSKQPLAELVVVGYGTQKKSDLTGSVSKVLTAQQEELPMDNKGNTPVKIRTNFNETAFFYPQLRTDAQGNVKFTFTAPESLTRWNVKMLAHTQDLYFGQGEAQVVTQKDLM
ncbi:MAG: MG2 domain-containing protein, partial [Bacteroidota bacterium]|nr:MG2 domain-containing protein [Bacteroidota bacterium]